MINKICKLKNLGIFSDYQWDTSLPNFNKYNVIYGWNGSGKTTLTKFLGILYAVKNDAYENLEYTVDCSTGIISTGANSNLNIRVFNQDYVNANVQMQDCKANPIFILGEENKTLLDQIKTDETELRSKEVTLKKLIAEKNSLKSQYDSKFTDIARTISANASGEATRRYDRRNAIDAYRGLATTKELSSTEIKTNQTTLKQLEKTKIEILKLRITLESQNDGEATIEVLLNQSLIDTYYAEAETLLSKKILSDSIERLREHKEISDWVEVGLKLHKEHSSKTCEFCNNKLDETRLEKLNSHFNEEDKILKDNLKVCIKNIKNLVVVLEGFYAPDKANFYDELQEDYQTEKNKLDENIINLVDQLNSVSIALEEKKHKVNISVLPPVKPNFILVANTLAELNNIISKHNDKTSNFISEKKEAESVLEAHYLSTIKEDITSIVQESKTKVKEIKEIEDKLDSLKTAIAENKSKITSPENARQQLNKNIHQFLGRKDISFEPEGDGYLIKRGKVIAKNLSEGEKTAIAFAYFIVHLKDQDFDINEGIVVIDDPISSLDSNSIFQAFSFLKNSVKDAKQVFIFTHNFDFLRLLINWLNYKSSTRELYMVNNRDVNDKREAFLTRLDKDLQEHESEYHYLFKKLYNFNNEGTIDSVYPIPNIARKVLDTFLMFRVPNNDSTFKKLEALKDKFDEIKITSLYKFTNDNSHITGKGFDPALIPECTKNVGYLMDLIKETFPEHYDILVASISS